MYLVMEITIVKVSLKLLVRLRDVYILIHLIPDVSMLILLIPDVSILILLNPDVTTSSNNC